MSSDDGWFPDTKPDWWETAATFAENPERFIQKRVATFLVGGVIAIFEAVTGRIRFIWEIIADAVLAAGDSLDFAFGNSGDALIEAFAVFPDLLVGLASDLGPISGPLIASLGAILLVFGLWQLIERAPGAAWKVYQLIPGT